VNKKKYLIVIVGPTGVGKTALSIDIASHFNTEIISADSRQIYYELKIGTARPSEEELRAVPHHFIGTHSIQQNFNVGKYEHEAIEILHKLFQYHEHLILTGGTGLYIDAICNGMDEIPESIPQLRKQLEEELKLNGIASLQNQLKQLDLEYYHKVDLNNTHRLIRALEVCMLSGKSFSSFRKKNAEKRFFIPIKIGLDIDRKILYERINKRVNQMMEKGLLEEAQILFSYKHFNALQTVGYKELFDYFDGKITLDKAIEMIKQNSRNYAKRQLTWFKRDKDICWFKPDETVKILDYLHNRLES
jgi:tRNA dimethylallyltransferase